MRINPYLLSVAMKFRGISLLEISTFLYRESALLWVVICYNSRVKKTLRAREVGFLGVNEMHSLKKEITKRLRISRTSLQKGSLGRCLSFLRFLSNGAKGKVKRLIKKGSRKCWDTAKFDELLFDESYAKWLEVDCTTLERNLRYLNMFLTIFGTMPALPLGSYRSKYICYLCRFQNPFQSLDSLLEAECNHLTRLTNFTSIQQSYQGDKGVNEYRENNPSFPLPQSHLKDRVVPPDCTNVTGSNHEKKESKTEARSQNDESQNLMADKVMKEIEIEIKDAEVACNYSEIPKVLTLTCYQMYEEFKYDLKIRKSNTKTLMKIQYWTKTTWISQACELLQSILFASFDQAAIRHGVLRLFFSLSLDPFTRRTTGYIREETMYRNVMNASLISAEDCQCFIDGLKNISVKSALTMKPKTRSTGLYCILLVTALFEHFLKISIDIYTIDTWDPRKEQKCLIFIPDNFELCLLTRSVRYRFHWHDIAPCLVHCLALNQESLSVTCPYQELLTLVRCNQL